MSTKKVAIGIDLGTSKCCVGVVHDGRVEILENERANKTTPSFVAFTDTERLVGDDAKDQATLNPTNTVFGVKRIIGRDVKDPLVAEAADKMPYTVLTRGETLINVSYKETEEFLLPQQITAMLLAKMKGLAESRLRCHVEEAVISVPASFSNAQRQATKDAATIAGLKVLALINEPTAAAITYQANRRSHDEENIAIVDFGAGKLDVAIVNVRKGCVSVKAVSGTATVGGNNITEAFVNHVGRKFEVKHGQKLSLGGATERLRSCCEKLKKTLTLLPRVHETLDCMGDDLAMTVTITREDFNDMIPPEVHSSLINCVNRAMQASNLANKEDIARVVLVGGSSRIPLFQDWLEDIFGSSSLDKSVNPDEAVAWGTALYAALLSKDNCLEDISVRDTLSNNFSFSIKGDSNLQHVFEQHSSQTFPKERVYPFTAQSPFNDKTRHQTFELYEELAGQKNPHRLIGTVCLEDEFRQAVRLISDVAFEVDRCGIFNAVVKLKPTHNFEEVVRNCAGKLSKDKLQDAIDQEGQFRQDDQDEKERVEAMSSLEALSFRLISAAGGSKTKQVFREKVEQISDQAEENIKWLDATNRVAKSECLARHKSLDKLNNKLQMEMQEYERQERERVATVNKLKDYLLEVETFMSSNDVSEEQELAYEIGRQVVEAGQWLESTQTPSKDECMEKGRCLEKLHHDIKSRLEQRRQDTERKKAIGNLQDYCDHLKTILTREANAEDNCDLTKRLIDRVRTSVCWLETSENITKADCDTRKAGLKEAYSALLEEKKALAEAERVEAVKSLQSRCNRLASSLLSSRRARDVDPQIVQLLEVHVNSAQDTLTKSHSSISKEECNKITVELQSLENTVLDAIDDRKQTEERRVATQKTFECEASKIKSTLLNKSARDVEFGLVRQISMQVDELSKWLKQPNQFSLRAFEEKQAELNCLVEQLRVKLAEANEKVLSEKSRNEMTTFEQNSTSATRHSQGAGSEGTASRNAAPKASREKGQAETQGGRNGGDKKSLSNGYGLRKYC